MKRIAATIFKIRLPLLIVLALATLLLGYEASRLQVVTDFSKMVPDDHAYIVDYGPYKQIFGGGNLIRVEVSSKQGTILTTRFLELLRKVNEDVMFVKGVDRLTVRSLVSPETRFVMINEEGFDLGPVVPPRIPDTDEGLAKIHDNILLAQLKGRLVSMDLESALITGEIYESGVDYLSVYRQLNEIRRTYTSDEVGIHINGFAMVVGFVRDALPKILGLFGASIFITILILYRCFRYLRLAVLPLASGALSVLWSLGIARALGLSLDPMTTIVPFLVLAIGVSHGIQMVKRYLEECAVHKEGYDAAMHALAGLIVPGVVALGTDAFGFLTILLVPIGVIRELALTATLGVLCIIVANILVLTLVLSFFPNLLTWSVEPAEKQTRPLVGRLLTRVAALTHGRNAYRVGVVCLALLVMGFLYARDMTVGDVNPGEPLLWKDSVYNQDAAKIMADFMLGIDWLSVVVTGAEEGLCKDYGVLQKMEDYEWEIGSIPGVTVVLSPLILAKAVNEMLHEGDIRWRGLPKQPKDLGYAMHYAGSHEDSEFMSMGCQSMNIRIFLSDHKGDTIRRVVARTKEFIAGHPMDRARFVLAGGNAGVMAATNEVVGREQVPMLALVYASVFLLCVVMFREVKGALFIMAPLFLVSVLSTAFMKAVGLGLNVNTLPVASLGVGVGVDYGIYIYSRLREERKVHARFADAVQATLHTTGAAVLYTAMTLTAGVFTWIFSDLKFQADMGILTGFLFIGNMIGAVVLMPTLVYIFDARTKEAGPAMCAPSAAPVRKASGDGRE
ncbi:MAG: MMPL family transporter [bacterium]